MIRVTLMKRLQNPQRLMLITQHYFEFPGEIEFAEKASGASRVYHDEP